MTIRSVLDSLPQPKDKTLPEVDPSPYSEIANQRLEKDMYDPFNQAMAPFISKEWSIVNSSSSGDEDFAFFAQGHVIKPDVTIYPKKGAPAKCNVRGLETFIEFKVDKYDDPFENKDDNQAIEVLENKKARDTRGQLGLYMNAIQASQQRTRVFGIYIRRQVCCILRHSRSGTEVTPLFDWTSTTYLQEFLWRLSHAKDAESRGHDTSFVPLESTDHRAEAARQMLGLKKNAPLYEVFVYSQEDGGCRSFIVSEPFTNTHTYPIGRGTRCFEAYDYNEGCKPRLVLLKDSWRVASYGRESDTYAKLKKEGVPYIPDVVTAGDIPGILQECGAGEESFRHLVHFRLVLKQVGRPIMSFTSTWELVNAISCAFKAHHQAVKKARILHRDISVGNIIIDKATGDGYLIDWEMAKSIDDEAPRTHERTGTLQFRSVLLLRRGKALHKVVDDIESFVQVLLWITLRYVKSKLLPEDRKTFLGYFDFESVVGSKLLLLTNDRLIGSLSLLSSPHFKELLKGLQFHAGLRYIDEDSLLALKELHADLDQRLERMNTHEWMEGYMDSCLANEEWKSTTHDGSEDQMPTLATKREREEVNRKSQEPEYKDEPIRKRAKTGSSVVSG
ncbi:hypothetical protein CONPUDRAFT_130045 [Coniophora puteana RWD-64-598 SS2]|uniref:Protein kinase domain-containing protein n=1 Tax=Coniophora puteana (strain RWD-64-598) TaxID=741705 RepID=A0A5M3MCD2_CONPW|nr:uncharacterized protein CONPUDRAFT_130045 [Coniophora puteana RWD-64-598 SS2]EIW76703.1 hypothetical protein CONPUDRAFT_130045 [Coniophora puteana RWD-64-598 SS2]